MKTLVTGLLIFACWASLSTWIYVCKIRGLCTDVKPVAESTRQITEPITTDSLSNTSEVKPVAPEMHLVYFEFDKSSFAIDSLLSTFSNSSIIYLTHYSESGLFIIGHTDDKGSFDYNQALGYRRAESIKDYFESQGISAGKITIVSKGEYEPAEDNSTVSGRAKNRRASISVINK